MIHRQQAEALIQEQLTNVIQQDAPKQSIFLSLARKLPNMTSKQTRIPVLDMLPMAYWVNGDTGFKQTSEQAWDNVYLTAEELAVIVPIPEAVVADGRRASACPTVRRMLHHGRRVHLRGAGGEVASASDYGYSETYIPMSKNAAQKKFAEPAFSLWYYMRKDGILISDTPDSGKK